MKSLKELPLQGKKVLVRVDFNVPLSDNLNVLDNSRVVAALPTIKYLLSQNAAVILMSHLGRPKGKDPKLSLAPCQKELEKLLNKPIQIADDVIGEKVVAKVNALKPGEVLLLENLRFYPAEEKPALDSSFGEKLASYADFYVDDAFGCAHRAHSSIVSVPTILKGKSAYGFLLEKEVKFLKEALKNPLKPFVAIIGGAKISSKIGVLKALLDHVDSLLIGGAMAFTFLKAKGLSVGKSLYEEDFIGEAKAILEKGKEKIVLPKDVVVTSEIKEDSKFEVVDVDSIPDSLIGADIGPKTVLEFSKIISSGKTLFWNGPMGVFEKPPFDRGTNEIANVFVSSKGLRIAGGGETVAALQSIKGHENIDHISTGGGASLELIEFGTLPGIDVLNN